MPDHTPSQSERYEAPAGDEERPDLSELVASALQRLR
jgi:hypothetical protein